MPRMRKYSFRDEEMLRTAKEIMNSYVENLSELSKIRTNWNQEFADNLILQINNGLQRLDNLKNVQRAARIIKKIQSEAIRNLTFLKTQIEVDFPKKRANDILKELGYNKHLKKAKLGDDKAVALLIFDFYQNMTPQLFNEIVGQGTVPELIDNIKTFAENLTETGITAEVFSKESKLLTKNEIEDFSLLYETVAGICKIASKFYEEDKEMHDKFTFSSVAKALMFVPEEKNDIEADEADLADSTTISDLADSTTKSDLEDSTTESDLEDSTTESDLEDSTTEEPTEE